MTRLVGMTSLLMYVMRNVMKVENMDIEENMMVRNPVVKVKVTEEEFWFGVWFDS